MKDVFIALLVMPVLFFVVWMWGLSVCSRDDKVKDRKDKANCGRNCCQDCGAKCGSIGFGRGLTLGQLSVKKKGGVE